MAFKKTAFTFLLGFCLVATLLLQVLPIRGVEAFGPRENASSSSSSSSSVGVLWEYFVDGTNGNDDNNGTTVDSAWKTLPRAQQEIQQINSNQATQPVEVQITIRGGTYSFLTSPWSFGSSDSGGTSAISSITWTAYQGEVVDIVSGILVPEQTWAITQVPNSDAVAYLLELEPFLSGYGLNATTVVGSLPGPNSLGDCSAIHGIELFFNQTPMYLSRYPNIADNGTWLWAEAQSGSSGLTLMFVDGDRPSKWVNETNLRLHGYWQFDWADSWVEVSQIYGFESIVINPATPPLYGSVTNGSRWMAINAISELDASGEYYIDKDNNLIYFIVPFHTAIEDAESWISVGTNVMVLNGLSHTTFSQLNFYYAQQAGVLALDVDNVHFVNCTIANHGTVGISMTGSNSGISGSVVYGTGCGGISAYGGVQLSLTPGNLSVVGNDIREYARTVRTYTPGISFGGVGNYYGYNSISNAPHSGMLGTGNNLMLEYNYLNNLCFETTDAGAFYTGRSWVDWGNVLQHNTFEQILKGENMGGIGTTDQVQAIYLDDQMSGWHVYNNTVINAQVGVLLGGGRMNNITQNHFQDCNQAIAFDNRGMNWQASSCTPPNGSLVLQLEAVNYQEPPFSTEYPWLPYILKERPCVPVYNRITDNTYCQIPNNYFINDNNQDFEEWDDVVENNFEVTC
eukprot:TRINITY_DN4076_c0_g1_i1.p1 TRINITY_DN4076_c0_g1~~TRINITY_DN4076_c0_g1_i1.p1  ORF type:complete len:696 (-),score=109.35 TRINITY_DN4076_c0_g1_i1:82-2130(-)